MKETGYSSNQPNVGTETDVGECLECGSDDVNLNKNTGDFSCESCGVSWNPHKGDYPEDWH